MRKVKIVTDSTSDLNEKEIKELEIAVMPLHVTFNEKSYDDGININVHDLYEKVKETGVLPKTAAITIPEYMEEFKKWIDEGYDVIFTGISKQMSSSMNNAVIAASELNAEDKVKVVDSKNLSSGIGLLVLKAAKLAKAGKSLDEIYNAMIDIAERVRSQFCIDTFEYLHKGGRCTGTQAFFGSMLKIKPIIVVRDGKMSVAKKPHGKKIKALECLLEMITADKDNLDPDVVMITHSCADEDAVYLKKELENRLGLTNVMVTKAGCVISSHCGPGTIGILYILNKLN